VRPLVEAEHHSSVSSTLTFDPHLHLDVYFFNQGKTGTRSLEWMYGTVKFMHMRQV
jgi:hypothetical protein